MLALGLGPVLPYIETLLLQPNLLVLTIPPLEMHSFGVSFVIIGMQTCSRKTTPLSSFSHYQFSRSENIPFLTVREYIGREHEGRRHRSGT